MKKMNWKLAGLAMLTALTSFGALTSCAFFAEDDAITIKTCTYVQNEDGSVTVTIVYANEDMKPLVFTIPAANGVKNITASYDDDENLVVKILMDNGNVYEFTVDAARGIDHVNATYDEENGDTLVTVFYTDGTFEETPIRIQKGDKGDPGVDGVDGKNGVGILSIVPEPQEDGSTIIYITMDDEEQTTYSFIVPPGVGITSIDPSTENNKNTLVITLSNGDVKTVEFDRMPGWFSGEGEPSGLTPVDGDFYYDTEAQVIYRYANGQWKVVVDFGGQSTSDRRRVTFDLNALDDEGNDDMNAAFIGSSATRRTRTEYCPKGHTFFDIHTEVPVPTRKGYEFAGWFAERNSDITVGGQFNSLTTVWSDMTVYARWEEAEPSLNYYTVNFVLNDEGDAKFMEMAEDIRNLKVSVPAGKSLNSINYAMPKAERDGFTFAGWAIDAEGTESLTSTTLINANVTAFAQWSN